jgi:chromate transporter
MEGPSAATVGNPISPAGLFLAFLEVGMSGFGGVLPFARRALVERRQWLSEANFNETLALCQTLPGPNVVNLSVVVGARFGGARGALVAVAGLVVAPVGVILVIVSLWSQFGSIGRIPEAMKAIAAAAAGLTGATALKMARPLIRNSALESGAVMAAAFVFVGILRWPLAWVLLSLGALSVALAWRKRA